MSNQIQVKTQESRIKKRKTMVTAIFRLKRKKENIGKH